MATLPGGIGSTNQDGVLTNQTIVSENVSNALQQTFNDLTIDNNITQKELDLVQRTRSLFERVHNQSGIDESKLLVLNSVLASILKPNDPISVDDALKFLDALNNQSNSQIADILNTQQVLSASAAVAFANLVVEAQGNLDLLYALTYGSKSPDSNISSEVPQDILSQYEGKEDFTFVQSNNFYNEYTFQENGQTKHLKVFFAEGITLGAPKFNKQDIFKLDKDDDDAQVVGFTATKITGNRLANDILGNAGDNLIKGGASDDNLNGSVGNDTVLGNIGNDTVIGGSGNDSLLGGAGNDTIIGGTGNDTMRGGTGNDTIIGGAGNDAMKGGAGYDVFELDGLDTGNDAIYRFTAKDKLMILNRGGEDGLGNDEFTLSRSGNDAVIAFDDGDSVTLKGKGKLVDKGKIIFNDDDDSFILG